MKANTSVEGLTVNFTQLGSNLYAEIIHDATGLSCGTFHSEPLPMGKRAFCKRVDEVYGGIDWKCKTFTAEARTAASRVRDVLWNQLVNSKWYES